MNKNLQFRCVAAFVSAATACACLPRAAHADKPLSDVLDSWQSSTRTEVETWAKGA